jgi:hypothetical protein
MASYSMMLLMHLSTSMVNWSLVAWHSFIPEGDTRIAAALALVDPKLHHNTLTMGTPVRCLIEIEAPSIL